MSKENLMDLKYSWSFSHKKLLLTSFKADGLAAKNILEIKPIVFNTPQKFPWLYDLIMGETQRQACTHI